MENEPTVQVDFSLKTSTYLRLLKASQAAGYTHPNGYARAMLEESLGVVDFNPLSADRTPLISKQERDVMCGLIDRPLSVGELAKKTGKWATNIAIVMKRLSEKAWVVMVDQKYTGGRPATIYTLTEAGKTRLEQEADRQQKIEKANEAARLYQAKESAKAHPPPQPKIAAVDPTTPIGAYAQACIDALYSVSPPLRHNQIEEYLTERLKMITFVIEGGGTSWAEETERVRNAGAAGWVES